MIDWQNLTIGCFADLIKADRSQSAVALLLSRYQAERFNQRSYAVGVNCAYRKAIFAGIGLFDDTLGSDGDLDLSMRLRKRTDKRTAFAGDAIVRHAYPETIGAVLRVSHFRGYGQGILNERYGHLGPLQQLIWTNLKRIFPHCYYFARRVLANPWRRRSRENVLDYGLRAVIRLGVLLGHVHHALDRALRPVQSTRGLGGTESG